MVRFLKSGLRVHSVLLADHRLEELRPYLSEEVPVYTTENSLLSQIVGFHFHLGVLACGYRPEQRDVSVFGKARTLIVLPEVRHAENLGLIIRSAHALGVDGVLMSEIGCDPFTRRVIRVSMGSVFSVPVVRSDGLRDQLMRLKREYDYQLLASVAGKEAVPVNLYRRSNSGRVAVLFGNEPEGLADYWVRLCDKCVTIPMAEGVDSLNLAVAVGIVMHRLMTV
ncbi:MAG: RNA methyltransferase [Phycisphaeraceae bacterium]